MMVAGVAALALCACGRSDECGIPEYEPARLDQGVPGAMDASRSCVEHWAKTYSRSDESAGKVADRAMLECLEEIRILSDLRKQEPETWRPMSVAELRARYREDALKTAISFRQVGCSSIFG